MKKNKKKTKPSKIPTISNLNKNTSDFHKLKYILLFVLIIFIFTFGTIYQIKSKNIFLNIQGYRSLITMPFVIIFCLIAIYLTFINKL